jgi:hypothetical protein
VATVVGVSAIVGALFAVYQSRHLFGFRSSEIAIRPMASTRGFMLFLIENDGNGPASVGRVTGEFIFLGSERNARSAPLRLDVIEYGEGKGLIPPGMSQQLRVHFADSERQENAVNYLSNVGDILSTECNFEFEIVNFDGSREILTPPPKPISIT